MLGKTLLDVTDDLLSAHSKYGIHILGEGGEFESLAIDAPWFHCGRLHIPSDGVERQVSQVQDGGEKSLIAESVLLIHVLVNSVRTSKPLVKIRRGTKTNS